MADGGNGQVAWDVFAVDIKSVQGTFDTLYESLKNGDAYHEFHRKLSARLATMGQDLHGKG